MKNTRKIKILDDLYIGGDSKVSIQSMTNTKTTDIDATVDQINALTMAGADIVRISTPNMNSAKCVSKIIQNTNVAIVCDIHFDYRIAIECIRQGAHKIRFNPGNIGDIKNVKYLTSVLKETNTPVRIGVNLGSIEKNLNASDKVKRLEESALKHVRILEKENYENIILSIKASDVKTTVMANRSISKIVDYPLHIGITEAGIYEDSIIKSSIGIGSLLLDDIGDTLRVSITGDPIREIQAAKSILQAVGKYDKPYANLISCPTCARCEIDLENLVMKAKNIVCNYNKNITVAIMGCVVNGPGEAKEADIAVVGGKSQSILIVKGIKKTIKNTEIEIELKKAIKEYDCV